MLVECDDDPLDDLAMRAASAFHVNVRLGVKVAPLVREPLESLLAIDVPQQRPGLQSSCPVGEEVDRGVEPDRNGAAVEQLPSPRVDEHLTPRGDYPDLVVDQPCDETPLAIAEVCLAESLKDFGRGEAGGAFGDRSIRVEEGKPEPLGQTAANRRLAGAHEADKDNRTIEAFGQVSHQ